MSVCQSEKFLVNGNTGRHQSNETYFDFLIQYFRIEMKKPITANQISRVRYFTG